MIEIFFLNIILCSHIYLHIYHIIFFTLSNAKHEESIVIGLAASYKLAKNQTSQYLKKRLAQHVSYCRVTGFLKIEMTALASHHFDFEHQFEFDNPSILDFKPVYAKRMISEMIHISLSDTVNFRTDTQGLCAT